jgi:hypothetical protein
VLQFEFLTQLIEEKNEKYDFVDGRDIEEWPIERL